MNERFKRTEPLIGKDGLARLKQKRVAVFGLGGVGSFAAEALARAGLGAIDLYDYDTVGESNINRQLIALTSTLGRLKTDVMRERIQDINPEIAVNAYAVKYMPENADDYPLNRYDYLLDAVDTVTAKLELAARAYRQNIPLISSMGTGNRLSANFIVADIYETSGCPLARVMRRELKRLGIPALKVVYTKDEPLVKENTPASISFVPPVAGLLLAGEVVRDLLGM